MTLRQTDLDSLSGQARFAEKQKLHVDSLLRKVKEDEVKKMAVVKGVYEANMERAREVQRQADERLKPLLTGTSTFQRGGGNNITQRKEAAEAASHPVMPQEALVLVAPMPMLMKETLRQHSSDSVQAKADQVFRARPPCSTNPNSNPRIIERSAVVGCLWPSWRISNISRKASATRRMRQHWRARLWTSAV